MTYLTTAISYPNGEPHIGHAYEAIAADAYARACRADGQPVRFLTGTDEHGLKIAKRATENGETPQELVDRLSTNFRAMADRLDISYDRFIRTTDADHKIVAQRLWKLMADNGDIYLGKYAGWYSVSDECFISESDLTPYDDGFLTADGLPVEWTEEESWFFRLSAYQDRLRAHIEANPKFIRPETRRNEVLGLLDQGLNDISISRTSFDWGIAVPDSPGHIMYVWVDALANYLSGADGQWPADLHVIGKDILKFHALFWPAFLMSASLPLPKQIFAHGFWKLNGQRMAKSTGNVVDPLDIAERFGSDQLRYYVLAETPFGADGDFTEGGLIARVNADLVNSWGNLIQRVTALAVGLEDDGSWPRVELAVDHPAHVLGERARLAFLDLQFYQGIAHWLEAVWSCNAYVASTEPWALKKSNPAQARQVLAEMISAIAILNEVIDPIIPRASMMVRTMLMDIAHKPSPLFPRIT